MKQSLLIFIILCFCVSCSNNKGGEVNNIETPEEIINILNQDDIILLDVRTHEEFERGHLENARHIDIVNNNNFVGDISKFDKNATYLIYCARGTRSQMASSIMVSSGFKNIYNSTIGYNMIVSLLGGEK